MDKQLSWYAVDVTVATEASEAIEFALGELDALGIEINNLGRVPGETLTVTAYFNDRPADEAIEEAVADALAIYAFDLSAVRSTNVREVVNEDWLAEWKKHWKPTVTERFVIAPVWQEIDAPGKIVMRIEPSMAFGTGTHETTRLCLRAIETLYEEGMTLLDVGTGTGILALAAKMLQPAGTPSFIGCDTDEDSIKIAIENAEINRVDGIEFYVGPLDPSTAPHGFVCANLTADVIVPILPMLVEKSTKFLVLSGILKTQESWVTDELDKLNAGPYEVTQDGEWISVGRKARLDSSRITN